MSLIGSVVERAPAAANADTATSQTPFPVSADPKTGFPAATHRQVAILQRKSAFRQNMEARPLPRDAATPVVQSFAGGASEAGWRAMMEAENARKVANMTHQEREEELRTIQSKFGDMAELAEVLRRAKDLRTRAENKRSTSPTVEEVSDEDAKIHRQAALSSPSLPPPTILHNPPPHRVASPARPILSRRSSVSGGAGTRAGTPGVRFAEVTPRDVFTYPSAPTSPKRVALMIEAPPAGGSEEVPKVQWKGKLPEPESEFKSAEAEPTKDAPPTPATEPVFKTEGEDTPMPDLVPPASELPEPAPEPELKLDTQSTVHPLSQVISVSSPSPPPTSSPPDLKLSTTLAIPAPTPFPPASPISLNLEPDTPEAIRLQYFPNEPEAKDVPGLQWMMDVDLPEIPDTPILSDYAQFYTDSDSSPVESNEGTEGGAPIYADAGKAPFTDTEMAPPDSDKDALRLELGEKDTVRSDPDEKDVLRLRLDEKDAVRFNLAGTPIPYDKAKDLPVHDGLHHNSRTSAGYTLKELLHLARSTAPMQRAMALDALARLTTRVGRGEREVCIWFPRSRASGSRNQATSGEPGKRIVVGSSGKRTAAARAAKRIPPNGRLAAAELRKLVIDSAGAALGERGAVGTRAVDCMYAALVVWDRRLVGIEDVELSLRGADAESNLHVLPSDYVIPMRRESGTNEMDVVDELPLDGILGSVTRHFKARWLPRSVLRRLLEVVVRLARQSRAHALVVMGAPELVPEIMRAFILSGSPYPDASSDQADQPDVLAIRLLTILARSSRQNAGALLDPTDTLLRFVAVLPPTDVEPDLLVATLDLYAVLGRYGMYAHIATTAAASFDALARYVRACRNSRLTRSWMRLRVVWTACATDPHQTTPAHEILWSQVEGWGWGADALALCQSPDVEVQLLPDVWGAVAAWVEGASVNGVKAGQAERTEAIRTLGSEFVDGKARTVVQGAVSRLKDLFGGENFEVQAMDGVAVDADILCAALKLNLALLPPSISEPVVPGSPLDLPLDNIASLARTVALHPIWEMVYTDQTISPYAYTRLGSLALFLGYFLILARRTGLLDRLDWLELAVITLQRFPPSCAETAAQIIREIGTVAVDVPSLADISEHLRPGSWNALLPFLLHDLQPEADAIISPIFPSPTALPRSATQLLPSRANLCHKSYHLPTKNDWTLLPLGHLLRSGMSPVFQALPSGWDSDEVDIVRTTLALTRARQFALSDFPTLRLSGAEIVFGCMRVFMLEHGQPHDDSSSEIFRDGQVERMMRALLSGVSLGTTKDSRVIESSPLEVAASRHLSGQPFYQFYTDLVGLYDAVSFAHPIFARVLLPPLSMNYAIDYRRLFWGDYGHIIRSVQTELADVPGGSLKEWLWPRDKGGEMIGWYLKALMKGGVTGFLRFVAVHHLAASLWPDLDGTEVADSSANLGSSSKDIERTRMIIGALVHQAGPALFSAVVLYDQGRDIIVTYPECWGGRSLGSDKRKRRLEWAVSLCGEHVRGRLEHVFNS